jgi:hypothetical protein
VKMRHALLVLALNSFAIGATEKEEAPTSS